MHSFLLAPLILTAGLLAPQEPKKWKPSFDYTNLPSPNEDMWALLGNAPVQFLQALDVARESEGEVRVLKAVLESGPKGRVWNLQLFKGAATETPKRVDLLVSADEPKIVHRFELLSLAPGDVELWNLLKNAKCTAADASAVGNKCVIGEYPDVPGQTPPKPLVPFTRSVTFTTESTPPLWSVEAMCLDDKDMPQRWQVTIKATGGARQKILLDRFVGEPLRGAKPTALDSGLIIHDFAVGDGEVLTPESRVKVHYRLFLLDGSVVFSTSVRQRPETFVVSKAPLKGMSEGMVGMHVGGRRKIVIPYDRAFGEMGNEVAPPRATVVCDVSIEELLTQ